MKKIFLLPFLLFAFTLNVEAQKFTAQSLPNSIYSGKQGNMHVQGVVTDLANGFVYMSFTDKLIKYDMEGNVVGSLTGLVGHLGDLEFDAKTGLIYGSIEYKDDAIGQGISKKLGREVTKEIGFYIAIIDGSKIIKTDMEAESNSNIIKTVYIKEAVDDYNAKVKIGDKEFEHRFACSGIDGVALAPSFETPKDGKKYLYVAYGVYGDTTRTDNDYQVILKYDIANWSNLAQALKQEKLHHSGPTAPMEKYFIFTGNTNWGIQNLAYDETSGNFFAAVYKGKKSIYPNYDLFVISGKQKPKMSTIISDNQKIKIKTLSLLQAGLKDDKSGVRGWRFKWGSTGLCPLGDGLFYISHNKKTKDKQEETTLYKYKWIGSETKAFELIK